MLPFAGEEDSFPGHEAVVEYHVGIRSSGQEATLEMFPGSEVMDGNDLFQSVPVARDGKGDSVVLVLRTQCPCRHYQYLIGHRCLGDVQLAAADDDTVAQPFFDPYVSIRVRLLGGPQHPIALDVRLGAAAHQVFGLEASKPLLEVLVVLGGAFVHLVCFVRNVVDGIGAVDAHAALDAAGHLLAEHAGHVLLLMQVVGVLVDVSEAADALAGEMRDSGAQVLVLWLGSFVKCGADGIYTIHL